MLKSIQIQSPLCVAAVIKYLDESGPVPFIIQKNDNSASGIKILKEEFNSMNSYNLVIKNQLSTTNSFVIAFPSKRFKGASIKISGHDLCKLDKNDSKYSKWISSSIEYVLVVTSLPSQQVNIDISPSSQGFIINGSIVSLDIQKPDLETGSQHYQIASRLSPTLKNAEKILEKVDESWDNAVCKVASSINHSRSIAKKVASKIVILAKLILFH